MDRMYNNGNDWKMFWIIEKQDLEALKDLCQQLKAKNEDIGLYFQMADWKQVFTEAEADQIKVYMCGAMDFAPVQHARGLGWMDGVKCLFDNEIGCNQGFGLPMIDHEKFHAYYSKIM